MSKEGSQIIPNIDGEKQDVDIIGIHGLDMNSPDAWTWRDDYGDFLWLSNSGILKERIGKAGVFIFDWPTVLIQHLSKTTKPIEQIAQFLLASIQTGRTGRENRPILFIAWGLGGIILMQVLCMAKGEYVDIQRATRGIIFLSTPFKEEGFQNVTTWTGPGLKTWSLAEDQEVDRVLENVVQSTSLKDLVPEFTTLCERYHYHVSTFYETNNIEYLCDLYGSLPKLRYSTKILVDRDSATLEKLPPPEALERHHVLMNKFPDSTDLDFVLVAEKIEDFLEKIRKEQKVDWNLRAFQGLAI